MKCEKKIKILLLLVMRTIDHELVHKRPKKPQTSAIVI